MIRTRSQLENLQKDELTDSVLSLQKFKEDINSKFAYKTCEKWAYSQDISSNRYKTFFGLIILMNVQ